MEYLSFTYTFLIWGKKKKIWVHLLQILLMGFSCVTKMLETNIYPGFWCSDVWSWNVVWLLIKELWGSLIVHIKPNQQNKKKWKPQKMVLVSSTTFTSIGNNLPPPTQVVWLHRRQKHIHFYLCILFDNFYWLAFIFYRSQLIFLLIFFVTDEVKYVILT